MISQAGGHGLSRFSRMEVPRMPWFSDRAGSPGLAPSAAGDVAFHLLDSVGTPIVEISRLNSPACACPCQRFATPSRDIDA